jgi:uncharacterized protein
MARVGEVTSHPPGTLSWTDLAVSDVDAAKRFYGELLGWEYDDQPIGDGMVYSLAKLRGLEAAALFTAREQPPHWNLYVTVASADDAAARAREAGGTILAEPFDVFDAGRMTTVQDPTGGVVSAWEARQSIGARIVNEPGAFTWADLVTPDPGAAARFYGDWLGWTTEEMPGAQGYRVVRNGDRSNGGMVARPDAQAHWMPYFGTQDLDAARSRAEELGARTLVGPASVPAGSFVVMSDTQGAIVAFWGGDYS